MLSFTAMHMKSEEIQNKLEDVKIVAVHIASIWPWFSVNELLYIFVILYKRENICLKKRESGYIGYVCILVIPLSLGTDISSNKSDFSTNIYTQTLAQAYIHTHTHTLLTAFLTVRKLFILIYKKRSAWFK